MRSLHIPKPELLFQVEAGKLNYLGDLVVTFIQHPSLALNWNFLPNIETMRAAYLQNRELAHAIPWIGLKLGGPPVELKNLEVLLEAEPPVERGDAASP